MNAIENKPTIALPQPEGAERPRNVAPLQAGSGYRPEQVRFLERYHQQRR